MTLTQLGQRFLNWILKSVRFGDLLTIATILISMITLSNNLTSNYQLQQKEQANTIRTAAAKALTNLETLQSLVLSLFDELQPTYVDVSQHLQMQVQEHKPLDPTISLSFVGDARDSLWLNTTQKMADVDGRILDQQIETGYADLLISFPGIRDPYLNALDSIKKLTTITAQNAGTTATSSDSQSTNTTECNQPSLYDNFLCASEQNFINLALTDNYQSADLGSALRRTSDDYRTKLKVATDAAIDPIRDCVLSLITKMDPDLLKDPTCPT